jgi:hypothetical protein
LQDTSPSDRVNARQSAGKYVLIFFIISDS